MQPPSRAPSRICLQARPPSLPPCSPACQPLYLTGRPCSRLSPPAQIYGPLVLPLLIGKRPSRHCCRRA
jgi:hypothetical protein